MALNIDAVFPGGNIIVESIDGNDVYLHQDLRDTDRPWFYWCFDIIGAEERTVHFHFTQSRALGTRGPAVSRDKGETWQWAGAECMEDNAFRYRFASDDHDVRFSFAMPYQHSHWEKFSAGLHRSDLFSVHTLCTTNKGRTAPYALLGADDPDHRIVLTARHHCCEMMVSYAIEGLIEWVLSSEEDAAVGLREHGQFLIVPFADLDGTENGDQGKGRTPHDHNRDYADKSLYAETAAIRRMVPAWNQGRLSMGIDLHCPWIAGKNNEMIYLVGLEDKKHAGEQRKFCAFLESVRKGPLPFKKENYLPFGTDWNTGANYGAGKNAARWFASQPGIRLGTGIEIPYANAGETEVNQSTARQFGPDLGRAIAAYLQI